MEKEPLFVIISGRTHISSGGNYFFNSEEVYSVRDTCEKKLKKQIKSESDPVKLSQFKYLLATLRIEELVLH